MRTAHGPNFTATVFPHAVVGPFLRCRLDSRVPDERLGMVSPSEGVVLREAVSNERVCAVAAAVARCCRRWSGGSGVVFRVGCFVGWEVIMWLQART